MFCISLYIGDINTKMMVMYTEIRYGISISIFNAGLTHEPTHYTPSNYFDPVNGGQV